MGQASLNKRGYLNNFTLIHLLNVRFWIFLNMWYWSSAKNYKSASSSAKGKHIACVEQNIIISNISTTMEPELEIS